MLLTGSASPDSVSEPSLSLDDFVFEHKKSNKPTACPSNNIGMVGALENLQMVLQVIFSDEFRECLRDFIDMLHGVEWPMFLVPADLLRYSVETALREFFRIVRSVRGSSLPDNLSLKDPKLCVDFLKALFLRMAVSLSNFATMQQHDAYYRFRTAVRSALGVMPKSGEKVAKAAVPLLKMEVAEKVRVSSAPPPSTKPCAGHMGRLLKAVKKDGTAYKCDFGGKCSYLHISPFGKSDGKLMDYVESMSPAARVDLGKAIKEGSWRKS